MGVYISGKETGEKVGCLIRVIHWYLCNFVGLDVRLPFENSYLLGKPFI